LSIINAGAFTLIELLVVISVIALLMAILMPCLQRVRQQARGVACQAHLRQWGVLQATFMAENDGRFPKPKPAADGYYDYYGDEAVWWDWGWVWSWGPGMADASVPRMYTATKEIMVCPAATKTSDPGSPFGTNGGTFRAWGYDQPGCIRGSYGRNEWPYRYWDDRIPEGSRQKYGLVADLRNWAFVPAILDSCRSEGMIPGEFCPPPPCDAVPAWPGSGGSALEQCCINRHNGCVNSLFLDGSVRRIGLKELWTLKWHANFNTAGPWTKRGGVKPEDWPQWLRRFKDY